MEAQGRVARPPNDWQIKVVYCSSCDRPTITVEEGRGSSRRLVTAYPRVHGRDPIAAEVPDPYKSDYEEACAVLPISPQSAAALARRILQSLIRGEANIKDKSLYVEIDKVEPTLPQSIATTLHTLRSFGNFAAHAQEDSTGQVLPVEPDEAEFCLDVIVTLFDHFFVGPARAAAMKAKYNATKAVPAGKGTLK